MPPEEELRQALKAGEFARADLATPEMGTLETPCPMRVELRLPVRVPQAATESALWAEKMRGELRLPVRVPPPDADWRSGRLAPFLCDGAVSVSQVSLEARAPRKGAAQLRMKFVVLVRPPQDKLSHLSVEVLLDGETVAKGGKAQTSTEEGRATQVPVVLELSRADYERWRDGVRDAVLRLTLAAVDN